MPDNTYCLQSSTSAIEERYRYKNQHLTKLYDQISTIEGREPHRFQQLVKNTVCHSLLLRAGLPGANSVLKKDNFGFYYIKKANYLINFQKFRGQTILIKAKFFGGPQKEDQTWQPWLRGWGNRYG